MVLRMGGGALRRPIGAALPPPTPPPPTPVGYQGLVTFPDSHTELILGPQTLSGHIINPWPDFDTRFRSVMHGWRTGNSGVGGAVGFPRMDQPWVNSTGTAWLVPGDTVEAIKQTYYYDLGLVMAIEGHRNNDPLLIAEAESLTDKWYLTLKKFRNENIAAEADGYATPRSTNLRGVIWRAHQGKPEYFPMLRDVVDSQWFWLNNMINQVQALPPASRIHYIYSPRDESYVLEWHTLMSVVDPDPVVREDYFQKAKSAIFNYMLPTREPGKTWFWTSDDPAAPPPPILFAQPFHTQLQHMALIRFLRAHEARLTLLEVELILTALRESLDHMWQFYAVKMNKLVDNAFEGDTFDGVTRMRCMSYFIYPDGSANDDHAYIADDADYGPGDTNAIRNWRQAAADGVAAWGYMHMRDSQLPGYDGRFKTRGDEIFAATHGNGQGPLADQYGDLKDFGGKEAGQSGATGGMYLVWRQAA